jgi:hypothetical protein
MNFPSYGSTKESHGESIRLFVAGRKLFSPERTLALWVSRSDRLRSAEFPASQRSVNGNDDHGLPFSASSGSHQG